MTIGGLVKRARFVIAALLAGMFVGAPHARAQSTSVQAQSLFDEGRRLSKAGKLAEACAAFDSSQKLDPAISTLLNLADCREQNHQLATAWGAFVEANRMARAANNAKLAKVASSHASKLEPRLSKLTITVPADHQVAGLEILRGGELVHPASWNHALPIDGGTYTISARAAGFTPWSTTRTIKNESDAQTVEVPKLVPARPPAVAGQTPARPVPPAGPPPSKPPQASPLSPPSGPASGEGARPRPERAGGSPVSVARGTGEPPPATSSSPPSSSTRAPGAVSAPSEGSVERPASGTGHSVLLPIAFGAGTVAFGGLALLFNARGDDRYDRAKAASEPQRSSLYQQANNQRYMAEAFLGAAIGCAGAGVYFYLHGRGEGRDTTAMTPLISPHLAGVALVGHW
jgi:hypothetical protein